MLGVFAEFERAMIAEWVHAGLARAQANGAKLGRPRISTATEEAIRRELAGGSGVRRTAALLRVGVGTVARVRAPSARTRPAIEIFCPLLFKSVKCELKDCDDKEASSRGTPEGRPRPVVVYRHGNARKQAQQCENCEREPALHFRVLP